MSSPEQKPNRKTEVEVNNKKLNRITSSPIIDDSNMKLIVTTSASIGISSNLQKL